MRTLARAVKDVGQVRRLLALAVIYDGGRRTEATKIGSVGLQIIWFEGSGNCPVDSFPDKRGLRFNACGPAGLIGGKAPGNPPKLNDDQRATLARIVERRVPGLAARRGLPGVRRGTPHQLQCRPEFFPPNHVVDLHRRVILGVQTRISVRNVEKT